MKRRHFVSCATGALFASSGLNAQPLGTFAKIGYLHPRSIAHDHPTLAILRRAWQQLGYVEGETVLLRSAEGDPKRLPTLVTEFVDLRVSALIVVGSAAVSAALSVTKMMPLVGIDLESDPVRAGFAGSFARPGGNLTGLFLDQPSIAGKWIELLREAAPSLKRVALLWDPSTGANQLDIAKEVARSKGFDSPVLDLSKIRNFDDALRPLSGPPSCGIVALTSPGFVPSAPLFASAAQKYQLPTIAVLKAYARSGVLLTYGPIQEVYFSRAVVLADRIAKGEKAADLPIEGPDRFELTINLKTARALGLTISQSLRLRADDVIE